jgi:hypothetical protein
MIDNNQMRPGFVPSEGHYGDPSAHRGLPFDEAQTPSFSRQKRATKARPGTAFLIDRGYRLGIDLTPCEINTNALSNRRWIRISGFEEFLVFQSIFSAVLSPLASETSATDVLYSVRGNR